MMTGYPCRKLELTLAILLTFAGNAYAADISIATEMDTLRADFAKPEILVNEALIGQDGGNGNIARIDQQAGMLGFGNYAEINQSGSSNQTAVVQTGTSNRARIDQAGSFNSANVTQSGSGNFIDLAQTGDANLTANQIGNYNSIVANMTNQNGVPATLSEDGNNNSIVANLNSPGIVVGINLVGDGLSITAH